MTRRYLLVLTAAIALLVSPSLFAQQKSVLFDAGHAQTAGNADWTLDEDSCGIAQRFPTPDQAGITSSTAETYWSGGHSAMGVDLVKKGFHVESLPAGARISYNDATNAQDLKNYNVFVIPEPNVRFTAAEVTAIRAFVQNGGGLLMIADHAGADRNNDGWEPPAIFNDLMGSPSIFGITYNAVSTDKTGGWFDDHPDANYTNDTTSPIVWTGPYGVPSSSKGLGLFGSTSMTISGAAVAHIWKSTAAKGSTSLVTFATSTYGTGRVAGVGDSSITEDATNGCGHTTYLGYNDPAWDNGLLIANAVAWLANGTTGGGGGTDTQAPTVSITAPSGGTTVSGTVAINATASDNIGVAKVEFYVDGTLKSTDTTAPYSYSWNTTTYANSSHTLVAKAYDAANNVGTSANVTVTVSNTTTSQQLLGNPGFETGVASPWTASTGIIDNSTGEAAHSGSWKAWLDGYGATHTDSLLQTVTIPSTATSATLSFWLHIDTAETGTTAFDTLKVQIRNTSGTVLATLATYSNVNAAAGFAQKSFSVLTYKGQTVQVYLVGAEDTTLQTSFVVDDFALNVQ
ncbi:MAG TPA: Ig-like domain-containing protein [Thermoanaerobaculia bacterium]|nr:Ig-like domain-containing protein [Thermoanaerobaculia bacterium]